MTFQATMTPEWIAAASKLWAEGYSVSQIADKTGIPRGTMSGRVFRFRDIFPPRTLQPDRPVVPVARRTYIAGKWVEHVKRRTANGDVVTLPRVSFIDGVREGVDA